MKQALKVLRDEATRLRREGIELQRDKSAPAEVHIAGASLCAASGRLLSEARKLEENQP